MKKIVLFAAMMLLVAGQNVNAQNEVNDCGTVVIPIDYDEIQAGNDGLFVVTKGKKKGVVDSNGKTIVPIEYDVIDLGRVGEDCGGLIVVNKQQKRSDNKTDIYGLYNKDGVMVAPMGKYERIRIRDEFGFEGMAEVSILKEIKRNVEYTFEGDDSTVYEIPITEDGVLLKNGTILTSYNNMSIEGGGLIEVHKGDLEGVLNDKGEIIVPIQYSTVSLKDSRSLIYVSTPYQSGGRKKGVYNNKGEVVVPVGKYESIDIKDTYIIVEQNGKKGILNQKGRVIVPIGMYEDCRVRECNERNQYYVAIISNKKEGAVNDNGKAFVPVGKYQRFRVLNDKLLTAVESNGKTGIVDKDGTMLVPIGKYEKLAYRYGVLTYSQNGKWGILDEKGNQVTPAEYDNIEPARHSNGMALVEKDGKFGVINSEGKQIIPSGNYNGGSIMGKIGFLQSNEGTVIFNLDGKILAPMGKYEKSKQQYGDLRGFEINSWPVPLNPLNSEEGLYIVTSNGKSGIVKLW